MVGGVEEERTVRSVTRQYKDKWGREDARRTFFVIVAVWDHVDHVPLPSSPALPGRLCLLTTPHTR